MWLLAWDPTFWKFGLLTFSCLENWKTSLRESLGDLEIISFFNYNFNKSINKFLSAHPSKGILFYFLKRLVSTTDLSPYSLFPWTHAAFLTSRGQKMNPKQSLATPKLSNPPKPETSNWHTQTHTHVCVCVRKDQRLHQKQQQKIPALLMGTTRFCEILCFHTKNRSFLSNPPRVVFFLFVWKKGFDLHLFCIRFRSHN